MQNHIFPFFFFFFNLTLKLLIMTIVVLEEYATLKPILLTIHQMQPFMLLYRKEPTFIQTHRSSLESKVLDFPTLIKTENTEFLAASNFGTHLHP